MKIILYDMKIELIALKVFYFRRNTKLIVSDNEKVFTKKAT